MNTINTNRAFLAQEALARLKNATPEKRGQEYDNWLFYATAGEVRKHHRKWFGAFPRWARK